jgi:hypothetical protein
MTLPFLETAIRYLQEESACMYSTARLSRADDMRSAYAERAAALSLSARVLAGIESAFPSYPFRFVAPGRCRWDCLCRECMLALGYPSYPVADARAPAQPFYKCACPTCPGYPYKASEMAHPCHGDGFAADAKR